MTENETKELQTKIETKKLQTKIETNELSKKGWEGQGQEKEGQHPPRKRTESGGNTTQSSAEK